MDKTLKVIQEMGQHSRECVPGVLQLVCPVRDAQVLNMNCDYPSELLFLIYSQKQCSIVESALVRC